METSKDVDGESESSLNNAHTSLWDATRVLEFDATGQLVVDFNLPPDLPVSCYPGDFGVSTEAELGRKYWRWQLRLRAEGASVDLRRTFVIPVEAAPIA